MTTGIVVAKSNDAHGHTFGIVKGFDANEYHADPCPTPSLSASMAHILESQSPAHAYNAHPRLMGVTPKQRDHFDAGTLIHALVLGAGKSIVSIDAEDWRTKAAREQRDEARSQGHIPVLACDLIEARIAAEAITSRIHSFGIALDGDSEVAAFWSEDGVQCRALMDHVVMGRTRATIYDLKSCRNASPDAITRSTDSYGYAIQRSAYVSALETIRPELSGRVDFVFLFAELAAPFVVTPVRLDGSFRHLGDMRWRRAVATWARCLRTGEWPGYVHRVIDLAPPAWAEAREYGREAMGEAE